MQRLNEPDNFCRTNLITNGGGVENLGWDVQPAAEEELGAEENGGGGAEPGGDPEKSQESVEDGVRYL